MTEMLAQKFDLAVVNLIKLKPLIKELGQYINYLQLKQGLIAVCQKNKAAVLERVCLFQKIEADHLADRLRSKIDEFLQFSMVKKVLPNIKLY